MGRIKKFLTPERLDKWIYWSFLLLALAECASEPLSRHAGKLAIFFGLIRFALYPPAAKIFCGCGKIFAAMIFFVAVLITGAIHSGHFVDAVTDYPLLFNYNMLLIPVLVAAVRDREKILKIFFLMGCSVLILDGWIFYQVMMGNMRPMPLSSRGMVALGIFFSLLTPAFFVFSSRLKQKAQKKMRKAFIIFFAAAFLGTIAAGIRALWLAVAIVLLPLMIYELRAKRKKAAAVLLAMCIVVSGIALSHDNYLKRMQSVTDMNQQQVTERVLMWKSSAEMARDNPLLGVGAGNWGDMYQKKYISPDAKEPYIRHAHSNYFQFLGEYGILGFAAYVLLLGSVLAFAWRRRKNMFAWALISSLGAFMIYTGTESSFLEYGSMRMFWLLLAACTAGAATEE